MIRVVRPNAGRSNATTCEPRTLARGFNTLSHEKSDAPKPCKRMAGIRDEGGGCIGDDDDGFDDGNDGFDGDDGSDDDANGFDDAGWGGIVDDEDDNGCGCRVDDDVPVNSDDDDDDKDDAGDRDD